MAALTHFYHVYADGNWRDPASEHVQALQQSGLGERITNLYIGYVGHEHNVEVAERFLSENLNNPITIARSLSGWEQETMRHIPEYLTDGPVLYAHTKGASNNTRICPPWRRSMTKECIINWHECLRLLDVYDTVGCHWLQSEDGKWFFGGTFWWANTEYLKTLPPVGEENRFMAEHWIGLNPKVRQHDLKPGHPGHLPLDTDWRT